MILKSRFHLLKGILAREILLIFENISQSMADEFKRNPEEAIINEINIPYSPFLNDAISRFTSLFNNEINKESERELNQIIIEINNQIMETPKDFQENDFLILSDLFLGLFLQIPFQSDIDFQLLNSFQLIFGQLSDDSICEAFTNQSFIEKIIEYVTKPSTFPPFINPASIVLSHLLRHNAIPEYDTANFLAVSSNIENLENRSSFLAALALNQIEPVELSLKFFPLVFETFTLTNPTIVNNCTDAICDCLADIFEKDEDFRNKQETLSQIFTPFLLKLQPEVAQSLQKKELVVPLIDLFSSLLNKMICADFFANNKLSDLLIEIAINTADEFYFSHIFPLLSDIFLRFPLNHQISPEFFNFIVTNAVEGTFPKRKSAIIFIANVIDQVIDDSPEYFHDHAFFELLIDMLLTINDGIATPLLECTSKLLSARATHFLDYFTDKEREETLQEILSEFDNLQDDLRVDDIDALIFDITRTINDTKPRDYEKGSY